MAHDIDVLIHFADKDNDSAKKNDMGWVTQFRKFLELMLYQVLGTKPKLCSNPNLIRPPPRPWTMPLCL